MSAPALVGILDFVEFAMSRFNSSVEKYFR